MRVLVIDSHKSSNNKPAQNMHWTNAKIISEAMGGDLIWSYPTVNDHIKSDYDVIIFVHASHYAYTDYKWLEQSPNAKLFYVTNEYNLGEPRTAWMAAKQAGRKYTVVANHPQKISKVVGKYVDDWIQVNLNSLVYNPDTQPVVDDTQTSLFDSDSESKGAVYYGSFRKGRTEYFKKYLNGGITLSTHHSNHNKFRDLGVEPNFAPRIDWFGAGLIPYKASLYIEDEVTHNNYNYLANRFYEALNYNCTPLFDVSCARTVALSDYPISEDYFVSSGDEVLDKSQLNFLPDWKAMAKQEKKHTLERLVEVLSG